MVEHEGRSMPAHQEPDGRPLRPAWVGAGRMGSAWGGAWPWDVPGAGRGGSWDVPGRATRAGRSLTVLRMRSTPPSAPARIAEPGEGITAEELQLAARNHGMPAEAL